MLSHSWRHHSVPAPTRRCQFPKDGVSVTGLGKTAGRSPGHLLPFVEQTLIKKRAEGCSLPPPSPPSPTPLSLLLFLIFAFGSIFLKTSLVIQSLPHLPNLHFIQEHQRCPVITTCLKEGKQLESNLLYLFYTVPSGFGSFVPCFLLLMFFPSTT